MSEIEEHKVDRTGWKPGPWDSEPDKIQWQTATGLPGLIVRANTHGGLCGYVGLPPEHPLRGSDYGDPRLEDVRVHGGLTYAAACSGHICHVPAPGEPDDVWWLGFDCAHYGDVTPHLSRYLESSLSDGEYRDVAYVSAEVESLAAQLISLAQEESCQQ